MEQRKIPLNFNSVNLPQDEVIQLIKKAQNGCETSRKKLVETNLKLVLNIAHRFKSKKESFEDLFQIGTIGLMKSIDNFDISKEVRFSTYAVPMILGEIKRYLRDNNHTMRISRSIQDNAKRIWSFKEEFVLKYGREPKISEIEDGLQIPQNDIAMALASAEDIISFSSPIGNSANDDKNISIEERIADTKDDIDHFITRNTVLEGLNYLNPKERNIIKMRFFLDKTQMEIGEEMGISQAQISRLEKSALKKMKSII